jgi:hypothetical protein
MSHFEDLDCGEIFDVDPMPKIFDFDISAKHPDISFWNFMEVPTCSWN